MKRKLFISNLDFDVTGEQLREMFATVGNVVSAVVALDRETRKSKGFAFVEMEGEEDAKKAIEQLNNTAVNGRPMKVVQDRGKTPPAIGAEGSSNDGERRREYLPPIQRMQLFKRRRKIDPFLADPNLSIDYKDTTLLSKFMSERGRILSRRLTGLNAYNQRKVSKAIKRAQNLGLLAFSTVGK